MCKNRIHSSFLLTFLTSCCSLAHALLPSTRAPGAKNGARASRLKKAKRRHRRKSHLRLNVTERRLERPDGAGKVTRRTSETDSADVRLDGFKAARDLNFLSGKRTATQTKRSRELAHFHPLRHLASHPASWLPVPVSKLPSRIYLGIPEFNPGSKREHVDGAEPQGGTDVPRGVGRKRDYDLVCSTTPTRGGNLVTDKCESSVFYYI